jgi:hypothetical protein
MSRAGRAIGAAVIAALTMATVPAASASFAVKDAKAPKWDARIQPYVDFVEAHRGLKFKRPIPVEFLGDKAFRKQVTDQGKVTAQDRAFARQAEGQLRALGLASGKFDLIKASNDLQGADVAGFYDFQKKRMVIRGTDIKSLDARTTIVHELTHALQDQYFNLNKLDSNAKTSGQQSAVQALVEGDAVDIEQAYVATLPQAEQDQYYGTNSTDATKNQKAPAGVPPVLDVLFAAPYVIGPPFIAELDKEGGTAARDKAFRSPPRSEEQIIDPVAWEQRQRPISVPAPKLRKGETRSGDPDELGAITLYLMLATRLDPATALNAVTGWSGDRYSGFRKNGKECLRAHIAAVTPKDLDELQTSLAAWAAKGPAGAATVARAGQRVELTACEAKGVRAPTSDVLDQVFFGVLGGRVYAELQVAAGGVAVAPALCVADHLVVNSALAAVLQKASEVGFDKLTPEESNTLLTGLQAAYGACGVPVPGG